MVPTCSSVLGDSKQGHGGVRLGTGVQHYRGTGSWDAQLGWATGTGSSHGIGSDSMGREFVAFAKPRTMEGMGALLHAHPWLMQCGLPEDTRPEIRLTPGTMRNYDLVYGFWVWGSDVEDPGGGGAGFSSGS